MHSASDGDRRCICRLTAGSGGSIAGDGMVREKHRVWLVHLVSRMPDGGRLVVFSPHTGRMCRQNGPLFMIKNMNSIKKSDLRVCLKRHKRQVTFVIMISCERKKINTGTEIRLRRHVP